MAKQLGCFRVIASLTMIIAGILNCGISSAVTSAGLPASVLPERAASNLAPVQTYNPPALPPIKTQPEKAKNQLGEAATKIKFKLTRIILSGNVTFSEAQLKPLYKNKLNTMITVVELQSIVQDITNYYRNEGYILSRAVLPPQHVANGIVHIQVVEGFIDHVKVVGIPKGANRIIQAYGNQIAKSRPLQIKVMEHYLLLTNEVPGVQVKAVLEPSKTTLGASDLNLVSQTKTFNAYLSYDNYGTRYIGPLETSLGLEADSIFRSGDSTQFNGTETTRPQQLKFYQVSHSTPLGSKGMRLAFSANQSLTRPGLNLAPEKIDGISNTFSATLQYPLIRSRTSNLSLDGSLNYTDSRVLTLQQGARLYNDHMRTVRAGANYDLADSWYGSNSAQAHVEQGLLLFGATSVNEGNTPGITSRFGASGHFTKLDLQYSRLQQFGASRYSLFFIASGQYTNQPLLATEQYGFGGVQQGLGRGYDPAEIIGDRGLAGSVELRANVSPQKYLLQTVQLYMFYDAGETWDFKNIGGQGTKSSATSTGVGARFYFTTHISGNLLFAQPLTKPVTAQSLIGDGRQPRLYFGITASV